MRLSKAIEGFLLFKRGEGLSPRTLTTYELHLQRLAEFVDDVDLQDVTATDVLYYLEYMRTDYTPKRWSGSTRPLSSQTIRNIWIALRSFWKWANQTLQLPNVMDNVPAPKVTTTEQDPLTAEQIKAMLAVVEPQRAEKPRSGYRYVQLLRDRAIILMLLDTGIRATELVQLTIGDVHLKTGRASITGKGSKHRYVRLASVARQTIWQYLAEREDGADPACPLFATRTGRSMSRSWLRKRLVKIGRKAGVDNANPHRFRYTFAIQYLRNGGDIFTLQLLLGHSSLKMVRHYAQVADVDSSRVHALASPVDRWLK